jgi:hypothetical protein
MNNFVKESLKKAHEFVLFKKIPVILDKRLTNERILMSGVISKLESLASSRHFQGIERIRIGDYDFLKSKDINAAFHDGTIYLTNKQDDDEDIIDDILHEMAHNLEKLYNSEIYDDGKLEHEFQSKRLKLKGILKDIGFNVDKHDFFGVEYNKEFDFFLYKHVTYRVLKQLATDLFCSVYGATSLREYYATGFQQYLMGNQRCLSDVSPMLFKKIEKLNDLLNRK